MNGYMNLQRHQSKLIHSQYRGKLQLRLQKSHYSKSPKKKKRKTPNPPLRHQMIKGNHLSMKREQILMVNQLLILTVAIHLFFLKAQMIKVITRINSLNNLRNQATKMKTQMILLITFTFKKQMRFFDMTSLRGPQIEFFQLVTVIYQGLPLLRETESS